MCSDNYLKELWNKMQFKIYNLVLWKDKLVTFPAKLGDLKVRFHSLKLKYIFFVIFHLKTPNKYLHTSQ